MTPDELRQEMIARWGVDSGHPECVLIISRWIAPGSVLHDHWPWEACLLPDGTRAPLPKQTP